MSITVKAEQTPAPVAPSLPEGDAPRGFVASVERLQEQLEEAQRLAGIGSWSWDLATNAVAWSRQTFRIFGIPEDTPPSFDLVLATAVDDTHRAAFMDRVQRALRGECDYDFEIPARLSSGRLATLHTRGVVERAPDGTPLRLVGTVQDVTSAREAEAALREREARFRTLAESSPTGVFQTDTEGLPVYANQRLLQWFAMDLATFAAGDWLTRVHPDDLAEVLEGGRRTRDEHANFDSEYRIVVDGRVRWLRVRTEPIRDSAGVVFGHIGSALDTSAERFAAEERARLQAQLQHSRRLESLGLLAGGVAHDFNNLLVGILANASLAREGTPDDHPTREALDDIASAAQRAADLTRQLLAYAGRARVERRQVALGPLVSELPKVLGARIPAHVELVVNVAHATSERAVVDGDDTQLRQVVLNLITNAVDAIGEAPGQVRVTVGTRHMEHAELHGCLLGRDRSPGWYAVVSVSDTGCGMSADVQERMFDPFFTTKSSGRGLGLAATLGILNGHAGAIHVESKEGQGTTIAVLLPVSRERPTPPGSTPVVSEAALRGSGAVLLVDDDVGARAAAARILRRAGYDVYEAANGAEAVRAYGELVAPLRVVVLDLTMPVMNGEECLRALRARGCLAPVLMTSGYDADDVASNLIEPGAVHFLQKPYTARALVTALAELLGVTATA